MQKDSTIADVACWSEGDGDRIANKPVGLDIICCLVLAGKGLIFLPGSDSSRVRTNQRSACLTDTAFRSGYLHFPQTFTMQSPRDMYNETPPAVDIVC